MRMICREEHLESSTFIRNVQVGKGKFISCPSRQQNALFSFQFASVSVPETCA